MDGARHRARLSLRSLYEKAEDLKPVLDRVGGYLAATGYGSGSSGAWQDRVDLSPEALQFLARDRR